MAAGEDKAARIREIFLSLPDTKETPTWGSPHFRVGEKIFGGFDTIEGRTTLGFKLEMEHAAALIDSDPRFSRAPYVGHKGWVKMDVSGPTSWDEVRVLVHESYRLIAPKRSLAKLVAAGPSATPKSPSKASARSKAASASAKGSARPKSATKAGAHEAVTPPAKAAKKRTVKSAAARARSSR